MKFRINEPSDKRKTFSAKILLRNILAENVFWGCKKPTMDNTIKSVFGRLTVFPKALVCPMVRLYENSQFQRVVIPKDKLAIPGGSRCLKWSRVQSSENETGFIIFRKWNRALNRFSKLRSFSITNRTVIIGIVYILFLKVSSPSSDVDCNMYQHSSVFCCTLVHSYSVIPLHVLMFPFQVSSWFTSWVGTFNFCYQ